MKTAAAYIRVSTDDQLEYSPVSQLKLIKEYAKKNGLILLDKFIFIDEGISGRNTKKRSEFNRMMGTAKQKPKPFDVILLWKFSRFARNRQDSIIHKTMLRKQLGIEVISISENLGDDKTSILIEALIEAMDEYYSINLAEEVKRGMTEKAHRGEPLGKPPLGYSVKNKKLIINEEQAPVIKLIFQEYACGCGLRELALKLSSMGVKSPNGKAFDVYRLRYILSNPVYIGKIRWNVHEKTRKNHDTDKIILAEGSHEPIIDFDTWNTVRERLKKQKESYSKYQREPNSDNSFMLQGLVKCSNCGSTLVRNSSKKALQCNKYGKGLCKISHYVPIHKINSAVITAVEEMLSANEFTLNIHPKPLKNIADEKFNMKQAEREKIKLQRIKDAYEAGIYDLSEFKSSHAKIMETIKNLKKEITPKKTDNERKEKKEFVKKHKNTVNFLKDTQIKESEKNMLLRSFINKIIFDRENNKIKVFFYD